MRIICCLWSFLFAQTTWSQEIIYKPTFIDPCTNEIQEGIYFYISDSNQVYELEEYIERLLEGFEVDSIILPRLGEYKLYYNLDDKGMSINVISRGVNRDTFLFERLKYTLYISTPPHSEYFYCDSLANGEVVDYYHNGNRRMHGIFEEGQPVDTVFSYYRNGNLSNYYIDQDGHYKSYDYVENGELESIYENTKEWTKTYYGNGQLKYIWDKQKRYRKKYYSDGQLKSEQFWNKKGIRKGAKTFFQNGDLKMRATKNIVKKFDQDGNKVEQLNRKETFVFERIFSKDLIDKFNRSYACQWKSYQTNGIVKRTITFSIYSHYSSAYPFPDSIQDIETDHFDEIIFYKDGKESQKIDSKYISENDRYVEKYFLYRKENGKWIKEGEIEADQIYKLIEEYSKTQNQK